MIYKSILTLFTVSAMVFLMESTAYAQPYGTGTYSSAVPYGAQTSLSMSASSGVLLSIDPAATGTLGMTAGTVTVYSTDVAGYKLYIKAVGSTDMTRDLLVIPASLNATLASLAVNTWGYNTTGAANFIGVSTTDALLKNATGPYASGDTTTVTYGLNIDRRKAAGSYSSNVMYTAVPQTN